MDKRGERKVGIDCFSITCANVVKKETFFNLIQIYPLRISCETRLSPSIGLFCSPEDERLLFPFRKVSSCRLYRINRINEYAINCVLYNPSLGEVLGNKMQETRSLNNTRLCICRDLLFRRVLYLSRIALHSSTLINHKWEKLPNRSTSNWPTKLKFDR